MVIITRNEMKIVIFMIVISINYTFIDKLTQRAIVAVQRRRNKLNYFEERCKTPPTQVSTDSCLNKNLTNHKGRSE